jgi:hypothetical protein
MKKINKLHLVVVLVIMLAVGTIVYALGTSPDPKVSGSFAILADTFTNKGTTSITGDLGYTTPPGVIATVNGDIYVADGVYNQAGIDQNSTLVALNAQNCDTTFPAGAIDLAIATTSSSTPGVYSPGVYCATGAINIGTAGIKFDGPGTYIFKTTDALNSVDNASSTLLNGASECDIWWAPIGATTLGANSILHGTIIDAAGITMGDTAVLHGRALAFGGTVTAVNNTITVLPSCAGSPKTLMTLIKTVTNDNSGTSGPSDWTLTATGATTTVSGLTGTVSTTNQLVEAGTYTLSESGPAGYTASTYSCIKDGATSISNTVTLTAGDKAICTINNNDNAPTPTPAPSSGGGGIIIPRITPLIHITKTPNPSILTFGPGLVVYTYNVTNPGTVYLRDVKVTDDKCSLVSYVSGDLNNDARLDSNESWQYICSGILQVTTKNTAIVVGYDFGGMSATDSDTATVIVSSNIPKPVIIATTTPPVVVIATTTPPVVVATTTPVVPKLPKTGFASENNNIILEISGLLFLLSASMAIYMIKQKKKI